MVGNSAGYSNTTANGNSFFGHNAGYTNSTGNNNTFLGANAGYDNTASSGTFIGFNAGANNTSGASNTAIGRDAGFTMTNGTGNVFMGRDAGYSATSSSLNVVIGTYAGRSMVSDGSNTYIGYYAGNAPAWGNGNVALGYYALSNNPGCYYNTAIGANALGAGNSGSGNTAVGRYALLYDTTSANDNSALGQFALQNTNGNANTGVGLAAGFGNRTGTLNTFVGDSAGYANTTGANNTYMGHRSGRNNQTGSHNTFVGQATRAASSGLSNVTAVGSEAYVPSDNYMSFGNTNVLSWVFGRNGITAGYALQVGTGSSNGNGASLSNGGTWTNASDIHLKSNITPVNFDEILYKINKLSISRWMYTGTTHEYHIGPMAQDFYELFHVGVNNTSISTIDPAGVALAGIQALSKNHTQLENTVKSIQKWEAQFVEIQNKLQEINKLKEELQFIRDAQITCCKMIGNLELAQQLNIPILDQNQPNPAQGPTTIHFYLPDGSTQASIRVMTLDGKELKNYPISTSGKGSITIEEGLLATGIYIYSLFVQQKMVDSKKMTLK